MDKTAVTHGPLPVYWRDCGFLHFVIRYHPAIILRFGTISWTLDDSSILDTTALKPHWILDVGFVWVTIIIFPKYNEFKLWLKHSWGNLTLPVLNFKSLRNAAWLNHFIIASDLSIYLCLKPWALKYPQSWFTSYPQLLE